MSTSSQAEKLQAIIKHAFDAGWALHDHDGLKRTGLHTLPEVLRYNLNYLIDSGLFVAIFDYPGFNEAMWGVEEADHWMRTLAVVPLASKIDFLYFFLETDDWRLIWVDDFIEYLNNHQPEGGLAGEAMANILARNHMVICDEDGQWYISKIFGLILLSTDSYQSFGQKMLSYNLNVDGFGKVAYVRVKEALLALQDSAQ